MKNYFTSSVIARIITSVLLLVALFNFPIGYYKFLKWVVCTAAIYTTYISFNKNNEMNFGVWLFCLIGILFNPIIPFYFGKNEWKISDLIVGIIFLASTFLLKERESY